jgi:hypothetical protein
MSFVRATSNSFLYVNALQGDILMHTGATPARVLFGTHGDAYSAVTIDSNLTTFTDAMALSNASGQVTLSCARGPSPASPPMLSVSGGGRVPLAGHRHHLRLQPGGARHRDQQPGASVLGEFCE